MSNNNDPAIHPNVQHDQITGQAVLHYLGKRHDLGRFSTYFQARVAGMKKAISLGYKGPANPALSRG